MAKLIEATTQQPDKVNVSFGISKFEDDPDGNLVVYGKATDGSVDTDYQIVDPDWSAKAIKDWLQDGGTLRVQHSPKLYPAGRGLEVETTPNGHYVKALVVEPTAQRLVKYGALRAFSVGIAHPVIERDLSGKARGGIIRGNERTSICEISLVDSPANKNCGFTLVKAESSDSDWEFGDLDELLERHTKTHLAKGEDPQVAKTQPVDREDTQEAGRTEDEAEEGENEDPDSDDTQGPASKAAPEAVWRAERHAWLQAEPKRGDAADGTEFLAKRANWQRWWAQGERDGLTDDGYPVWSAKRKMDPDVGGGVDRDKIPAEDFAGRNRSFPIVTAQDVKDAARSLGRAGDDNYSTDQIKSNIIRIARRKGLESALPDAWKAVDPAMEKTDGKPGRAVQCEDCNTYNKAGSTKCKGCGKPVGDDASEKKPAEKTGDHAEKAGSKSCPKCSKVYHADTKVKFCKKCGTKLPGATAAKSEAPTMDAQELAARLPIDGMDTAQVADLLEKMGIAKKRSLPADTKPAGRHREPDGTSTIERLEPQAGLGTDPDPTPDKVPASVGQKVQAPYALLRAHDAVCAAYHPADVLDAYPTLKSVTDALDPAYWQRLAAEKADAGKAGRANELRELAEAAQALKGEDADLVADARAALHKSFTSMYPTANVKPGMNAVQPGMFNRPYIGAGHAPMTASGTASAVPPSTHVPDPGQFTRGPLTAGQERPSPGNKGGNNPTATVASGAVRSYYTARARDAARNALAALHDHIAGTYPDACVLAPSGAALSSGMGASNVPTRVMPGATGTAPGEKNETAQLVKALVAEATGALREQYETEITALKAEIDLLGSQPDPTQAPPRGAVRKMAGGDDEASVKQRDAAAQRAEKAARDRAAYISYLTGLAGSGDPVQRMNAEKVLATYLIS